MESSGYQRLEVEESCKSPRESATTSVSHVEKPQESEPTPLDTQRQTQEGSFYSPAIIRNKISHRSQSSPSSLTTHKFGLRPTPSPPRLIIDHNTGDIIESYPERPTYLRTYQPISTEDEDESIGDFDSIDSSLPSEFFADQQQSETATAGSMNQNQNNLTGRTLIPPPHSSGSKVYFAPPEPSNAGHLFLHQASRSTPKHQQQLQQQVHLTNRQPIGVPSGSQSNVNYEGQVRLNSSNNSFRRALSKINDSMAQQTDIAIVTDDNEYPYTKSRQLSITATPNIGSTSPNAPLLSQKQRQLIKHQQAKLNSSKAKHQQQQLKLDLQDERKLLPMIEDFNLYNFWFILRIDLVLTISALIIYLLVVPLANDCTKYRPTFSYISIIICSVNLICTCIFTLFWYCSGVTRTLYSNLSSSAFIVSSYSILVTVNLAFGILLFFVNTCHFQRIMAHRSHLMDADPLSPLNAAARYQSSQMNSFLLQTQNPMLDYENVRLTRRHSASANFLQEAHRSQSDSSEPEMTQADDNIGTSQLPPDGGSDTATETGRPNETGQSVDELDGAKQESSSPPPPPTPKVSPIEAFWLIVKDSAAVMRRQMRLFLERYDLKLIGALHALCAICLQYLAMKVAVVRSHFCSPVGV